VAGLVPAIYAYFPPGGIPCEVVGGRNKSGHGN
jgi:hypothetical protein